MQWQTPSTKGIYQIRLGVVRSDGSTGRFIKEVFVDAAAILGEPPKPPEIVAIRLYNTPGLDDGTIIMQTTSISSFPW